jgi:hypothetical protein
VYSIFELCLLFTGVLQKSKTRLGCQLLLARGLPEDGSTGRRISSSEMGHLHCSSSSSAVVGTATGSAGPEKHPWLSLAALLAADAAVALAMTVAATLGLCSGCLLCLLPVLLLLLAMKEVTALSPQGLRTKAAPVHQCIRFAAPGAFKTLAQLKGAHMCKRSQARIVQLPDIKPYSQCAIYLKTV